MVIEPVALVLLLSMCWLFLGLEQIEATYIAVSTVSEELNPLLIKQLACDKALRLG